MEWFESDFNHESRIANYTYRPAAAVHHSLKAIATSVYGKPFSHLIHNCIYVHLNTDICNWNRDL